MNKPIFITFDLQDFINCADEVYNKSTDNKNRGYAWFDCMNAFSLDKNNNKTNDEKSKDLFIYLANWGMVARGSFVMQHTWRIFNEIVNIISEEKYNSLRNITSIENDKVEIILKLIDNPTQNEKGLYNRINKTLKKYHDNEDVSSALITKILLGTTGCTVAYDSNVRNVISMFKDIKGAPQLKGASGYSKPSLKSIYDFYIANKMLFDRKLKIINKKNNTKNLPEWTIMKLIDACMWNYWNKHSEQYLKWKEKNKPGKSRKKTSQ